jgi:hypothetical protein
MVESIVMGVWLLCRLEAMRCMLESVLVTRTEDSEGKKGVLVDFYGGRAIH